MFAKGSGLKSSKADGGLELKVREEYKDAIFDKIKLLRPSVRPSGASERSNSYS